MLLLATMVLMGGCLSWLSKNKTKSEVNLNFDEKRLINIQQLTFFGENAEAYFSSDGESLIYFSKPLAMLIPTPPPFSKPKSMFTPGM